MNARHGVGVLLAAGGSRRMGSSKPLVRSRGMSFLGHGLHCLWAACDTVVVVLGAEAPRVRAEIEAEFERLVRSGRLGRDLREARRHASGGLEARFVVNRSWRQGMLSSARLGLRTAVGLARPAPRRALPVVLVLPVDHPHVRAETAQFLAEQMRLGLGGNRPQVRDRNFRLAIVPRHRRRRGHPLALSPALAAAVVADRGAADLSDAMRRNAQLVGFLDLDDPGVIRNRNRPTGR